jgi:hypothetical protein
MEPTSEIPAKVVARRGRPRVGAPKQVRLSDVEQEQATNLGDGVLALGLRRSLRLTAILQSRGRTLESLCSSADPDASATTLAADRQRLDKLMEILRQRGVRSTDPTGDQGVDEFANEHALELGLDELIGAIGTQFDALSEQDRLTAQELGDGALLRGVQMALHATRFLGIDTIKKLNS